MGFVLLVFALLIPSSQAVDAISHSYENITCDSFVGQEWLNSTYEIDIASFSNFWTGTSHWFNTFRKHILAANFTFPILVATNWNETEWTPDPKSGKVQRTLEYDIDPKSAFIETSHVIETQVVLTKDGSSLVLLRTLTNSGFPLADSFRVEFLLCAKTFEDGVEANVRGQIVANNPLYWLVKSTVEEGVFRGAKEYYEIFDHSLNVWINEQKEYSRRNTLQPKYTNIPGSNGYDSSTNDWTTTDDLEFTTLISRDGNNFGGYDVLTYFVVAGVAVLLVILTIIVHRQKE